jgi:hypothetical protein
MEIYGHVVAMPGYFKHQRNSKPESSREIQTSGTLILSNYITKKTYNKGSGRKKRDRQDREERQ